MKNNLLQVLLRRFFSARISPAEYTVLKSEVQKATDEAVKHIDTMTANKEKELLEV